MGSFEDRERAAESKFVMDAASEFKAEARRNKKLAIWAAELLGKSGDDVNGYIKEVIAADFEEAGDEDVFRKLRKDLDDAGVDMSDTALRDKMKAMHAEARVEIKGEQ